MNANERRASILKTISVSTEPISATNLAKTFQVSRQSIVGDIANLRASGIKIVATARGYLMEDHLYQSRYLQRIASQHSVEDTYAELSCIVNLGGEIIDVIIEHEMYGELKGRLDISSNTEIDEFIKKREALKAHFLSELTNGIHIHTIATENIHVFDDIYHELDQLGFLVNII